MCKDKFSLSTKESRFLLKKSLVEMIHQNSRLEKVNTTFPQTKTIVEGMSVSGVSVDDIQTILNLKNAYNYILNETKEFNLEIAKKINSYVSYNESLDWGVLRYGDVGISGVSYKPSIPVEEDVVSNFNKIMSMGISDTHKIIKYMYYAMRSQLFWDGNKRTAIVSANYMMLQKGRGILVIREIDLEKWNELLSEFYETNDDSEIIKWTYENCIYGIEY